MSTTPPTYPISLNQITLSQRIGYDNLYGKDLKAKGIEIEKMEDSSDKDVAQFDLLSDSACKSYSFFTGIDIEAIKSSYELRQVINVYAATLQVLLEEEADLVVEDLYSFNDEDWVIAPLTKDVDDQSINWNHFQAAKETFIGLMAIGNGDWSSLPNLCALYFRKPGESLEDVIPIAEARAALFQSLTLDIAMSVALYLKQTVIAFFDAIKLYEPTT